MILNLTQHPATSDQIAAGVVDLVGAPLAALKAALTFDTLPTRIEIDDRADQIAALVASIVLGEVSPDGVDRSDDLHADGTAIRVMIGGAPFLMSALESALINDCRVPVYAFSVRDSVEEKQADGSVKKSNVFNHAGFVDAV
jgi:hypothetical protein